jgi:hypothetical protein
MMSINRTGRGLAAAALVCSAAAVILAVTIIVAAPIANRAVAGVGGANVTAASGETENWADWKHRMPVRLDGMSADTAGLLPVDLTFSLKASEMSDPANARREIRLIHEAGGKMAEVPFQISRLRLITQDTERTIERNDSKPSVSGMITFFPVKGEASGMYWILYGNPAAKAPEYETALKYSGAGPAWTLENSKLKVALRAADKKTPDSLGYTYGNSGQLSAATIKSRPGVELTNTNRVIHWNPGIYIPERGWIHSYAWDPPDLYEIEAGPVFIEVRRAGAFPQIPEARLAVSYRLYAGRDYVYSGTRVDVVKDIGVVALRNDQLVFNRPLFDRVAWMTAEGELFDRSIADLKPYNEHGDVLRLEPDVPFLAFFNSKTQVGAATVRLDEANIGPLGGPVTNFDHATYVSAGHGAEAFIYWFRPQNYFNMDWDRTQLIGVPAGSTYGERNLYVFYDVAATNGTAGLQALAKAVRHRPDIKVGDVTWGPRE